jgi:hypothetical protein
MAAMPPPTSVRVLLFHPGRPVSRATIDWVVSRQAYARVIIPPALLGEDALPARARHEPFASPGPESARIAAEAAALLAGPGSILPHAAEASALALLEGAAVIAADAATFSDLIPLSSWSMNVPERPTDGLLVQHLGIAGRLPAAWMESAAAALEAILSGDAGRIRMVTRTRRLAARREGPDRFSRLAKRSAGLRPAVVYLDLLAASAAAGPGFTEWLRRLENERAAALLSVAAAVFT